MLAVREIAVAGYRSLRRIGFLVEGLSVFAGGNGAGKTNLYRALELLQAAALGILTRALAAEGGMESALWAGRRRSGEPARICLSATLRDDEVGQDFTYSVEVGLVPQADGKPVGAAFLREPQVKAERLSVRTRGREAAVLDRDGAAGFARDEEGRKRPSAPASCPRRPRSVRSWTRRAIRRSRWCGGRWRRGASITVSAPTPTRRCAAPASR